MYYNHPMMHMNQPANDVMEEHSNFELYIPIAINGAVPDKGILFVEILLLENQ
jgi:hypothetical protein